MRPAAAERAVRSRAASTAAVSQCWPHSTSSALRAGRVAEAGVVAHAAAFGVAFVDDDVRRGAGRLRQRDALVEPGPETISGRLSRGGVQVEQQVHVVDHGAHGAGASQFAGIRVVSSSTAAVQTRLKSWSTKREASGWAASKVA